MATIDSIATQRNGEDGKAECYRFRDESDVFFHTRYAMKGNGSKHPLFASARGIVNSRDDPRIVANDMLQIQEMYHKTSGLRIRGEIIRVDKSELRENKLADIKAIAERFCDYYMGLGHQVAYGIYDLGWQFEIVYSINTVNYADGSKYRHNRNDIQMREEMCLSSILAEVTGAESKTGQFDMSVLEYSTGI